MNSLQCKNIYLKGKGGGGTTQNQLATQPSPQCSYLIAEETFHRLGPMWMQGCIDGRCGKGMVGLAGAGSSE